jgi:hypothetical protein
VRRAAQLVKAAAKSLGDVDATPYRWWDVK